jgi:hypothetical protein
VRCYVHRDVEAVGACKSCLKGLCPECAAETNGGLACRAKCESEVEALVAWVRDSRLKSGEKAERAWRKTGAAYSRQAWMLGILGGLILLIGLIEGGIAMLVCSAFAAIVLLGAWFGWRSARSFREEAETEARAAASHARGGTRPS